MQGQLVIIVVEWTSYNYIQVQANKIVEELSQLNCHIFSNQWSSYLNFSYFIAGRQHEPKAVLQLMSCTQHTQSMNEILNVIELYQTAGRTKVSQQLV